jgi:hypothetical protein
MQILHVVGNKFEYIHCDVMKCIQGHDN